MLNRLLQKALKGLDAEEVVKVQYSFLALLVALFFHAVHLPVVYFFVLPQVFLFYLIGSIIIFLIPAAIIFWGNFYFFSLLAVSLEWLLLHYLQIRLACGYILPTVLLVQVILLSYTFFVHGLKSGFSLLFIIGLSNLSVWFLREQGILANFCRENFTFELEKKLAPFLVLPNFILLGIIFAYFFKVTKVLENQSRKKTYWQKAIIDSSIQYIAVLSPQGEILLQDKKSKRFLKIAQFRGKEKPSFWDYYPANARDVLKNAFTLALQGVPSRLELKIPFSRRKDSYFDVSVVPIKDKLGSVESVIIAGLDITGQKKIQEQRENERRQLRTILDNIPHLVASVDQNLNIRIMNRAFIESFSLHNFPFSDEIKNFLELMPREYRGTIQTKLEECLKGKKVYYELTAADAFGKNRIYGISYHPIFDSKNQNQGIAIFAEEITERKEYENALLQAKKAAEEANQLKSKFLANMSHEMRTPLNVILGYTELILEKNKEPTEEEFLRKIQQAGYDLKQLIEDILELSQLESGIFKKSELDIEIYSFFRSLLQFFQYDALKKNLKLKLELDQNLPKFVLLDARSLRLVLLNLLSNAIKFTQEGYVKLTVKKLLQSQDNYLEIMVEDSGPGIPQSLQEKIFERFTQGDSSYTKEFKGTGLGLTICRQLVEKLQGKISLKSTVGEGTTFTVVLPYKESKLEIPNITEAIAPIENTESKTILVAEDNEDNMLLFETFLKATPHKIIKAKNGLEAFEIFQKEKIDLILMDMQMPIMDGFTATQKIRQVEKEEKRRHTPIAAVTAYVTAKEIDLLLESGCDAYLAKPFKKDNLLKLIAKLLSSEKKETKS